MTEGWIKLHRKMEDHWLYPTGREFTEYEAWQDLLLQANHKPSKVRVKNKVLICHRGESLRSIKQWARRWRWSKSKVYRFFSLLEDDNMIKTQSERVTTRVKVCNYNTYQKSRNADETQSEQSRNEPETTPDTNKNEKNEKNKTSAPAREETLPEKIEQAGSVKELADLWFGVLKERNLWPTVSQQEMIQHQMNKWGLGKSKRIVEIAAQNGWKSLKEDYLEGEGEESQKIHRPVVN